MRSALETLKTIESPDGRYAVLGDMLELGESAANLHREIGEIAAGCVDALVAIGEHASEIAAGAISQGMSKEKAVIVKDHAEAVDTLQPWLQHGARILVKGSRGMRMEQACELLYERLGNGGVN
jgi:UDP-N-acetylmuramoyl-tripeptide--D-alanyl-D-alanine ligase